MLVSSKRAYYLRLGPKTEAALQDQCPESLSPTAFCALLIEQGLTRGCTLGGASESFSTQEKGSERIPSTSSSIKESTLNRSNKKTTQKKKDEFSAKHLPESIQVPDAIVDCDELLREFWSVKKGARSERVWSRLCNKLGGWTPEDRRKALEASISNGWGDVFEPRPERPAAGAKPAFRTPGINPAPSVSPQFQKWLES